MSSASGTVRWIAVITAIMAMIIALFTAFEQPITDWIDGRLAASLSPATIAALIVAALVADILLPIPSSLVGVAAGAVLGFWGGAGAIWLGLTLGGLFGYALGAGADRTGLRRFVGEEDFARAHRLADRFGVGTVIVLRAVPVLAETTVLAAGMVRMPLRPFLISLAMANAGVALVYGWLGAQAAVWDSFVLAVAAGIAVPGAGWLLTGAVRRRLSGAKPAAVQPVEALNPRFDVAFDYPVLFTDDVFNSGNPLLADTVSRREPGRRHRLAVFVDAGVAAARPCLTAAIAAYAEVHGDRVALAGSPAIVPGGEAAKLDPDLVPNLHRRLLDWGIDRQSLVVAVGGGAMLDAVGFAAATFHRGVRLVRLPTTVLGQNDAGIGVKNGVNFAGMKNLIGCFAPPFAVINDSGFLSTLPERDRRAGLAEAVKVAAIRDAGFFAWLEAEMPALRRLEPGPMAEMIRRCAALHLAQIARGGDPFETGSARPLDYGHWSAHKLEQLTHFDLRHGEAVAIGMALDARYAVEAGLLRKTEAERLIRLLEGLGFRLFHPALLVHTADGGPALLRGLDEFREHLGGLLCVTMMTGIGRAVEVDRIDRAAVMRAAKTLAAADHAGEAECA
jgi:3-dehydroquinate synthase